MLAVLHHSINTDPVQENPIVRSFKKSSQVVGTAAWATAMFSLLFCVCVCVCEGIRIWTFEGRWQRDANAEVGVVVF